MGGRNNNNKSICIDCQLSGLLRELYSPWKMCQKQSIGLQEDFFIFLTISIYFFKPNHFHFNFMCVLYYTYYFNIVVHVFNL